MINKNPFLIFGIFCIIALVLPNVSAIGITPPKYEINFEPRLEKSFTFGILYTPGKTVEVSVGEEYRDEYKKADLSSYVRFDKTEVLIGSDGMGHVTVTLNFPEKINPPGRQRSLITATEPKPEGGGIGGIAAINGVIYINVPYPGKYLETELSSENIEINQPAELIIKMTSRGKEMIKKVSTIIEIYDANGNLVDTLIPKSLTSIVTNDKRELKTTWDTTGVGEGVYTWKAKINYDGNIIEKERSFKIGSLSIRILNFTKQFSQGRISVFDLEIQSIWNAVIKDVYAYINILKGTKTITTIKTPNYDISGWQVKNITAYLDAANLEIGSYPVEIVLHYENKTTTETGIIEVLEGVELEKPSPAAKTPVEKIIIAVMVGLLIVIIIVYLLKRK